MVESRGFPFERTSKDLGKRLGSVVVPCDLQTNVSELHDYLFGTKNYMVSPNVRAYSQTIVANTGVSKQSAIRDEYANGDSQSETAKLSQSSK